MNLRGSSRRTQFLAGHYFEGLCAAVLFCAASILFASSALAGPPDPVHSSIGNGRLIVGGTTFAGGTITETCEGYTGCGAVTVTIRDFANNIVPDADVIVDFAGCPDMNISCDQLYATTGQTYLEGHKVQGTTNSRGQFTFRILGAGPTNTATCRSENCAGTNAGIACAPVYALGSPIGSLRVAAFDVDRSGSPGNAVSIVDVSKVKQEQLNVGLGAASRARDDYDFNGTVAINDVSLAMEFNLDTQLDHGSRDTEHGGWSTWPSAGTPSGFCP